MLQYFHACLFSPTKTTLLKAIKQGNFASWPGFTYANVAKYLFDTPATALGHLDQVRQGLQSTKSTSIHDFEDEHPTPNPAISNQVIAQIISFGQNAKGFFDLTVAFPYTSSRGNCYILILYAYDCNAILVHPLKTKQAHEIKAAWIKLHNKLHTKGFAPSTYIMDNEASTKLKNCIVKNKITYQLTPPNMHRINAAERAIRTFKNHFLAGLATIDPKFPIREWD